ncbi:MAG: hypothetical protein K0Q79_597 [Flavipsychrobacter sp.]|jgi:hypothetical protein|nr:hypothetical protein [Flavipsychrobacter sp.]
MKKIFTLVFFIFPAVVALAQQNNIKSPNPNIAGMDPSVVAGHFEMERTNKGNGQVEHINVNYSLSPAPFDKVLDLDLSTAENILFSAVITDAKNKEVARWAPANENYFYKTSINISPLPPGDYLLTIYWQMVPGIHHYSIPFTKNKQ